MNSCEYYQELISSLVDGELSDEENEALMLHLNSCSRCNAMYAVFHDLSDILSEEPAPLPEGLHENIMAGVRRSELVKRNRRLRRIGLRTAMTAAACAVLVLFAAVGFDPGKRADSVSIHSEQEASQLLPAPSLATGTPAVIEYTVPTPAPTSAPVWTPAPTYDAGSNSTAAYTPVQPEQTQSYSYDTYGASDPIPAWTPAPVQTAAPVWTPAPVQTAAPVWTPAPVYNEAPVWTPAPAQSEAPLWVPAPEPAEVPVWTTAPAQNAPAVFESATAAQYAEPAPSFPTEEAGADSDTADLRVAAATPEVQPTESNAEEAEDSPTVFSLFSSMVSMFDSASPDQLDQSLFSAPTAIDAALDERLSDGEESPAPINSIPLEPEADEEISAKPVAEEHVNVYGSELRAKLLSMIGRSEDALPREAELTRLVHVTLLPDDSFGSEERMDISIYGDFVYCSLYPVEGGSVTYRADCSLKDLDDFLSACAAVPVPSAAPTPDPFVTETPTPSAEAAPAESSSAA